MSYITILGYNFGDALNEPILRALSSNKIDFVPHNRRCSLEKRISAIGSVAFLWTGNTIVWGSGVLDEHRTCPSNLKSMEFKCVRGPLTRNHLQKKGYKNIPETYCDPGILASYFYRDILCDEKKFDFGVFPHHMDNLNWYSRLKIPDDKSVIFINSSDPIDQTIRRMSACKRIISSSLHGIIVAESLGIQASWYRLTDINDPFKFFDYFEGTNRQNVKYIDFRNVPPENANLFDIPSIELGTYNINGLLDSCPFEIENDLKKSIVNFYENSKGMLLK